MSISEKDWREEQVRVDEVTTKIAGQVERLEAQFGETKADMVDIRKHFWDEVTLNFSNMEEVMDTYFSIKQQADVLTERERSYRNSAAAAAKLRRMIDSPYFGRIDFREAGEPKEEPIYLGIASFVDEASDTFLIYDWRAPVSSLYYDYPPGPAVYQTPGGDVAGEMTVKRQYVIRGHEIKLMFDTGITIGDELLKQVLSRSSDAQMKTIVATIQKEQNRIIRDDSHRMLIVQGAAGSGKTSAALQRVAYLLYKHRETLKADQMLLFSPNPLFNSYVSTVLPELGEENMQQTTFQEYLQHRLGKDFEVEDPFQQLEYVLSGVNDPDYAARMEGIRYKSSVSYLNAIRAYYELLGQEGMAFRSIRFRGRTVVAAGTIKERFYSYDRSIRLPNRIVLLRDWLLEQLASFEKDEWKKAWVEEEIELLSTEDYQRAYGKMRRMNRAQGREVSFDDFEKEKELLARMIVQEQIKPVKNRIKNLRFVHVQALYRQLFQEEGVGRSLIASNELPPLWSHICKQTLERLERSELAYEDATPYLYLSELLLGFQTNTSVRHVIVDEAQDYSPFQLEFLKRLFPRARMTALGDINQAIYAHGSVLHELDPIVALYGPEQTEIIRLTRSYRSTQEIVEFTRGMLPGGEEIEPFQRSGEKPTMKVVHSTNALHEEIARDVESLRAEGFASIAIIAQSAEESAAAYEALRERLELRLITKSSPSFEQGTLVIPAYLAKGVEFDAVILYNASKAQYSREEVRKLFYTACTRAMHQLRLYSLGEPTPFVTELARDTWEDRTHEEANR
ncbi:RNA polymerase recycling motor HelD [Paenibacillus cremeus]|uniref:AAA family ATPase n=1 Tax=Paenibacillus cremeus TaxID=2163881 RepID=A0A559K689_9BACL|nr:RNA polymerase recycling motor HelD [Paenibacillus cremeus]TVY07632.1 AAA family ATPase [Paenibacillus cremeus]